MNSLQRCIPLCGLSLHSGNCFLCYIEVLKFDAFSFVLFLFNEQLESYLESFCLCLYLQVFSLCLPVVVSKSCIKLFDTFWIGLCIGWEIRICFSVLYVYIRFPNTISWRGYVFVSIVKNLMSVAVCVYFWIFYSMVLVVCFCGSTISFGYSKSFMLSYEF
jgi:hypothetical protein